MLCHNKPDKRCLITLAPNDSGDQLAKNSQEYYKIRGYAVAHKEMHLTE